jgi:hypothetical protein
MNKIEPENCSKCCEPLIFDDEIRDGQCRDCMDNSYAEYIHGNLQKMGLLVEVEQIEKRLY